MRKSEKRRSRRVLKMSKIFHVRKEELQTEREKEREAGSHETSDDNDNKEKQKKGGRGGTGKHIALREKWVEGRARE